MFLWFPVLDLARAPRRTARKKGSGYENVTMSERMFFFFVCSFRRGPGEKLRLEPSLPKYPTLFMENFVNKFAFIRKKQRVNKFISIATSEHPVKNP